LCAGSHHRRRFPGQNKLAEIDRDPLYPPARHGIHHRKYKPTEIIDWCVKLARIAEGYIPFEHPRVSPVERENRNDYNVQVRADLSRLNAEQLIALKQLALIASAGSTTTISAGSDQSDRPHDQRKAGRGGASKDWSQVLDRNSRRCMSLNLEANFSGGTTAASQATIFSCGPIAPLVVRRARTVAAQLDIYRPSPWPFGESGRTALFPSSTQGLL
jgi:hypothetical protein